MIGRPSRWVTVGVLLALALAWIPVPALADEAPLLDAGMGPSPEVFQPTGVLQDAVEILLLVFTLVRSAMRYWANGHRP